MVIPKHRRARRSISFRVIYSRRATTSRECPSRWIHPRTPRISLCRLYQATGQAGQLADARVQLGEVYEWFTERLNTAELVITHISRLGQSGTTLEYQPAIRHVHLRYP